MMSGLAIKIEVPKNFMKLCERQALKSNGKINAVLINISIGMKPKDKNPTAIAAPNSPLARQGLRLESASA